MTTRTYFSGYQLFWVVLLFELGMTILVAVSPTIQLARQDAWVSCLLVTAITFIMTVVVLILNRMFPGATFIECSRILLGPYIGSIVGILYALSWATLGAAATRQSAEFVKNALFDKTPIWAIVVTFTIVVWFALRFSDGIDSVGKTCNLLGPVSLFVMLLLLLMLIGNFRGVRLMPVNITGQWPGVLMGTIPGAALFNQTALFGMVLPFLQNAKKQASKALFAVLTAGTIFTVAITMVVGTLGPDLSARISSPLFTTVTFISIGSFLQNLDILAVIVWYFSGFVRISMYQFGAAYGLSQVLGVRNWKLLNPPLLALCAVGAILPRSQTFFSVDFVQKFVEPWFFPYLGVLVPCLLLVMGVIKKTILKRG